MHLCQMLRTWIAVVAVVACIVAADLIGMENERVVLRTGDPAATLVP